MIKFDVADFQSQLNRYTEAVKERLNKIVYQTVIDNLAYSAIEKTPFGNLKNNYNKYMERFDLTGLDPEPGYAKGSWLLEVEGYSGSPYAMRVSDSRGTQSKALAKNEFLRDFELGDSIYLSNNLFYIGLLNDGFSDKAPEGMVKPTVDQVMDFYATNAAGLFNRSRNKLKG